MEIPPNIIEKIRRRSNRSEQSRFPYKVWTLLDWAKMDPEKQNAVGCGWLQDNEFFINKNKLCEILDCKLNTLNVNLKTLGFIQTKSRVNDITYWRNNGFTMTSDPMGFERIRNSRCKPDSLVNLNHSAVYLPLLENLQLYNMDDHSINVFKREVVERWENLVGSKLIFAVTQPDFMKVFTHNCETMANYNDVYVIQQVLAPRIPNVIDIFDFAVFLARFGPFNDSPYKIFQYQTILSEIRPDFFMFNAPSLTSYFSNTFNNCFRFQLPQNGEYHCYNLPLVSANAQYLVDEDGAVYQSWHMMLQQNLFLTQHM